MNFRKIANFALSISFAIPAIGAMAAEDLSSRVTIHCQNFYNHFGKDRVLIFEAAVKNSDHIPDAMFIIDENDVSFRVLEKNGREYDDVIVSDELTMIQRSSLNETFTYEGEGFNYHLYFDRRDVTMKTMYASGDDFIESSVDTSVCVVE